MKIAIASTGLGRIHRGIETWALDTANALHRRGVDVTLFASAPVPGAEARLNVVPCLGRGTRWNRWIVRCMPAFTWRWGLKSDYALEQQTFWTHLHPQLTRERFDLLHVQDPTLADRCRQAWCSGRVRTRVILAHGTEEPLPFLKPFEYLQHLAPWHLQQSTAALGESLPGSAPRHWVSIPNFVNTETFRPPASPEERRTLRQALGLPVEAFILGTVAAIKRDHKHIDSLITAFAKACTALPGAPLHLMIAGASTPDTAFLRQLAAQRCPGRITFVVDAPHEQIPDLLRTLDVFALASRFEMMPIALLEAIATGIPAITHDHPVLAWMTGVGGIRCDMGSPEALIQPLHQLIGGALAPTGMAARRHAVEHFSETVVIDQYLAYYDDILHAGSDRETLL